MNPESLLFDTYANIPEEGAILCAQLEDANFIASLASTAKTITVFHRDGLVVRLLKTRLARYENITVAEAVFPSHETVYDLALVGIPKGRDFARAVLVTALRSLKPECLMYASGPNKGGAKTAESDMKSIGQTFALGTKQRYRVFSVRRDETHPIPTEWQTFSEPSPKTLTVAGTDYTVHTQPGVFSHDHLDEGTELLLNGILGIDWPYNLRILDAGCGYGIVGAVLKDKLKPSKVVWADIDLLAVQCVQATYPDEDVVVADVAQDELRDYGPFDLIACNPPFHKEHMVDRSFMQGFAENAARLLSKNGRLVIVYNSFLPYADVIAPYFKDLHILGETNKFTVLKASSK